MITFLTEIRKSFNNSDIGGVNYPVPFLDNLKK